MSGSSPGRSSVSIDEEPPASRLRDERRALDDEPYLEQVAQRAQVPLMLRRVVDAVALGAVIGILLSYFRVPLLLDPTTTTGGDTGAHIYLPWYLRNTLLPAGQITGWSPDWYAGFPAVHFYFPLVPLFQAVLSYAISYEVAFKMGTVLGTFFLPVAVYLLFRLLRFSFPAPILAAVLSLAFLFMDSYTIYGGNIPSSMAGEYGYVLSMGLSLVFLGLAYRVATEERSQPLLAGAVLGLAAMSHLLPLIMVVLFSPVLVFWAVRRHGVGRGVLRLAIVFGVGFAITAVWSIPFLVRLPYATNMNFHPIEGLDKFAPEELRIFLIGALSGLVLGTFGWDRRILVLTVPAVLGGIIYLLLPQGHVWNGRFLPFWYLGVILTAAYFVGSLTTSALGTFGGARFRPISRLLPSVTAVLVAAGVLGLLGTSIVTGKQDTFIDEWIQWNYQGYEGKTEYPTHRALMQRLSQLPPGRVLWESTQDYRQFGTADALMPIPYFAGQPTLEGLYYESSLTTPFHFLMVSEISDKTSRPIPDLPYPNFDLQTGLAHMRLFDVRYYVTWTDRAREAASAARDLRHRGDVGNFSIFELRTRALVEVPKYRPVVLEEADWMDTNVQWFIDRQRLDVPLVREGPADWERISSLQSPLPRTSLPGGGRLIRAEATNDEVRFTTDAVGQPHWIKVSYFPNWKAEGAEGPFLASPSFMMVIPTQSEVRLRYERTWAESSGGVLTLGALSALTVAAVLRLRRRGSLRNE